VKPTVAAFVAARFSRQTGKLRAPFALLFCALLMCVVLSKPVWAAVPFLPEVQFPWRWLTIVSAAGAIVFAASAQAFTKLLESVKDAANFVKGFAVFSLICILGIYALMWSEFSLNHIPAGDYENYVAEKSAALGGEWFWTAKTKEEAFAVKEKVVAGARRVEIQTWRAAERNFTVAEGNPASARVATLFYPHWKASVNGTLTAPQISDDGVILVPVPSEKAQVKIWFEEPSKIVLAKYLSLFTWLAFACAGIFLLIKRVKIKSPDF